MKRKNKTKLRSIEELIILVKLNELKEFYIEVLKLKNKLEKDINELEKEAEIK